MAYGKIEIVATVGRVIGRELKKFNMGGWEC